MPKISVIMPVRNAADFIKQSVGSVLDQTLQELELVCVDDSSTDGSAEILSELALKDPRIKLITYDVMQGAAKARKDGILRAEGKYIMFLDADDFLEPGACEFLYRAMEGEGVDIFHFSAAVENCGAGATRTERMQRFVAPYTEKLSGKDVFFACFEARKYRFNLWNKIFRAAVCKEAIRWMEDDYLPKANDLYIYFLIAYFARSYKGAETAPFYHYCFGKGSTGNSRLSLEQFKIYCREKDVTDKLYKFVQGEDCEQKYFECVKFLDTHFLEECLNNWKEYLDPNLSAAGFDLLAEKWKPAEIANTIALKYHKNRDVIARKLYGAKCLTRKSGDIKTIGVFYFRMAYGGVQRVISLQIPVLLQLGYQVVLFVEEENKEFDFEIPAEVKKVLLPTSFEIEMTQYAPHGFVLEKALREYNVDLLLYQAGSSDALFYDLLVTKMQGILFIPVLHEMFSQRMVSMDSSVSQKPDMFRVSDELLVLSHTEKKYWETLGVHARYIPNPVQSLRTNQVEEQERDYILWIGRFGAQQKRFDDAVHVMNYVVEQQSDAQMKIVGSEYTKNAKKKLSRLIKEYHLENNIEVLDYQKDVAELYTHAKVHLLTSTYEAFPMTVVESKSYGVPLVTYELPYVELLKEDCGSISVPQEDRKAAADAVITILQDEKLWAKLSKEAKASIIPYAKIDYTQIWEDLLKDIAEEHQNRKISEPMEEDGEDYAIILKTILFHYTKAVSKYEKLQKQNKKLQIENEKLKGRVEYRVRRKLGKIKNKIINKKRAL